MAYTVSKTVLTKMEIAAMTFLIGFVLGGSIVAFIVWRTSMRRIAAATATERTPFASV